MVTENKFDYRWCLDKSTGSPKIGEKLKEKVETTVCSEDWENESGHQHDKDTILPPHL